MVLGGTGWDKKESPKSNLHVCGKDDTKIVVYNMERCIEKGEEKIEDKDWDSCTIWIIEQNHIYKWLNLFRG